MFSNFPCWEITQDSSEGQNVIPHGTLREGIRYNKMPLFLSGHISKYWGFTVDHLTFYQSLAKNKV